MCIHVCMQIKRATERGREAPAFGIQQNACINAVIKLRALCVPSYARVYVYTRAVIYSTVCSNAVYAAATRVPFVERTTEASSENRPGAGALARFTATLLAREPARLRRFLRFARSGLFPGWAQARERLYK